MVWSGHHHSYQRTCPVFNEKCVDDGLVQVVFGNSGARLYDNLVNRSFIEVRNTARHFESKTCCCSPNTRVLGTFG